MHASSSFRPDSISFSRSYDLNDDDHDILAGRSLFSISSFCESADKGSEDTRSAWRFCWRFVFMASSSVFRPFKSDCSSFISSLFKTSVWPSDKPFYFQNLEIPWIYKGYKWSKENQPNSTKSDNHEKSEKPNGNIEINPMVVRCEDLYHGYLSQNRSKPTKTKIWFE